MTTSFKDEINKDIYLKQNGAGVKKTTDSFEDEDGSDVGSEHSKASTDFLSTERTDDDDAVVRPEIGAAENQRVIYSRILVALVLLASAALTAAFAYLLTASEEQRAFEIDFEGIAAEIIEVSQTAESNLVKLMFEFGTMITSSTMALGQTWPNVTIPDYERRASALQDITGGKLLVFFVAVEPNQQARDEWYEYTEQEIGWYNESLKVSNAPAPGPLFTQMGPRMPNPKYDYTNPNNTEPFFVSIPQGETSDDVHLFSWQVSPPPVTKTYFLDRYDYSKWHTHRWQYMKEAGRPARSPIANFNAWLEEPVPDPVAAYYQPIYKDFEDPQDPTATNTSLVGYLSQAIRWKDHFVDLLHDDAVGIVVVLKSTCGSVNTYEVNGPNATYLGEGDLHDPKYTHLGQTAGLTLALNEILEGSATSENGISCGYSISVYPSAILEDQYTSNKPWWFALIVLAIFGFTTLVFVIYDCLVQRRQETVMDSAVKTDAIVRELIPDQFRDQMMANKGAEQPNSKRDAFRNSTSARSSLHDFVSGGFSERENDDDLFVSKPVADLFPSATVLFADIVGFTAWSSVREPSQVFTLLETLYHSFDKVARKRKIYKVETVGDCYVCVAGLPVPMPNHAVVMARFARECIVKIPGLTRRLERFLGPGTGDIQMRFGLHSGPVTAGVLRGEKARFQLFGNTVNLAARIETSGMGNRVHLSENTARLLIDAGKGNWCEARAEPVHLRGIGTIHTYWLHPSRAASRAGSVVSASEREETEQPKIWGRAAILGNDTSLNDQTKRLVSWNTESLLRLLQQVVAGRGGDSDTTRMSGPSKLLPKHAPLEEVVEVFALPGFDAKAPKTIDPETIDLGPLVKKQMFSFVSWVADAYLKNPFHNFEHASHVSMSVNKLLSRIVAPQIDSMDGEDAKALHDHTYGITSDPLIQFGCALAALIHDVDHRGVPNGQLVKEDPKLGEMYDQSVAEQNSVDLAWAKLMSDEYSALRACIYTNTAELQRFRQVVVNTVLATDIFDKKLKALRNQRWATAFKESPEPEGAVFQLEAVNRKATIVIEHIIQASDVSHTMQHWHVYTKWNEKLFREMYVAYKDGRSDKDPTDGWYGGEIWFYDNYVIPLAKKLAECGVFGVSSDEYLNYALENRMEWEQKGKDIVAAMAKKCRDSYEADQPQEQLQEQALPTPPKPMPPVIEECVEV